MKRTQFVSVSELIAAQPPMRTDSYTPISHAEIVDLIQNEALKRNLTVVGDSYKVNSDFSRVIGYFDINANNNDLGMRVAFKNSYDKSMAFGVAIGASVWICENGVISGEIVLKRKHTGSADDDARQKIIEGFAMIGDNFMEILEAKRLLEHYEIDRKVNAELIGRMFMEHEFINTLQLNIIKKECESSTKFTTIHEPGYTAWDLYNNVTHSLKESSPMSYLQDHIDLHQFMMSNVR